MCKLCSERVCFLYSCVKAAPLCALTSSVKVAATTAVTTVASAAATAESGSQVIVRAWLMSP
jgi:hypothetical protein